MTTTFNLTDFFARHFPDLGADERIEIRAFPQGGGAVQQSWHATPLAAAQAALRLPQHLNIFFGIQARRDRGGKKADVTQVRVLWADMDFKRYADGREGALQAIEDFPLPPTVVVDSGNGFHLYWYLATAIEPSAAIEQLLGRLYRRLGGLDAVQDLSRVLRVPETFNNKTTPAKLAQVRHTEYEAVYTLADFAALLPAPVEPERVAWTPPTNGGGRSAYSDIPSIAEMREILRFIPPGGDYKADWLRILAAVHSLYPGPEGEAMCAEWCDGKPGEITRKFASFKRDGRADDAASVGTLIHIAKQHNYEPPRRTQAGPKFSVVDDAPDAGEVLDVLEMAQALDTERRENAELRDQLEKCRANTKRLTVENSSLRSEVAALEAAAAYPDQTVGGIVVDLADYLIARAQKGDTVAHEGQEAVCVVQSQIPTQRSYATLNRGFKKILDAGHLPHFDRDIHITNERVEKDISVPHIYITDEERTDRGKLIRRLLPPAPEAKKHGGARRKHELPDFGEVVEGPIEITTEKKRIYTAVADQRVLKVTPLEMHTEHCDPEGYQMTVAEVDEFRVSIGQKVQPPAYRPVVQLPISEADQALTAMPRAAFDAWLDEEPVPIPLHGKRCAMPGCVLPPGPDGMCARHESFAAMTGAD